jgi:ribosomal protein S27AE
MGKGIGVFCIFIGVCFIVSGVFFIALANRNLNVADWNSAWGAGNPDDYNTINTQYMCGSVSILLSILFFAIGVMWYSNGAKKEREEEKEAERLERQHELQMMAQVMQPRFCPQCGSQMRFVNEYTRWFCDRCQQYK